MTTILQDQDILRHRSYGVRLGLYPSSDRSFSLELSRAFGSSTHAFQIIAPRLSPLNGQSYTEYVDRVPFLGTNYYYYRMRSVQDGWTASPYTSPVKAKPGLIGADAFPQIPLNGGSISLPIYLSSAATPRVGSQGKPSVIRKTMRFWSDTWVPSDNTQSYALVGLPPELSPNAPNTPVTYHTALPLPRGIVVSGITIAYHRINAQSTATILVNRASSTGGSVTLKTLTGTTGAGLQTMNTSTLSLTITSTNMLHLIGTLRSGTTAATVGNASIRYVDVSYSMASFDQAY